MAEHSALDMRISSQEMTLLDGSWRVHRVLSSGECQDTS